jgi:hypothetical protein
MPALIQADVMLSVRSDRPAGVIRAYLADRHSADRRELARLDIRVADEVPGAFDLWVAAMTEVVNRLVEQATGVKVARNDVIRPHDMN